MCFNSYGVVCDWWGNSANAQWTLPTVPAQELCPLLRHLGVKTGLS